MTSNEIPTLPMKEPLADLERELIGAYVAGAGQPFDTLVGRDDEETRRILTEASLYATARLSEAEARLHYLRSLRGEQ